MATLGDYPAGAVLRAEDLGRASKFYTDVLGLKREEFPGPAGQGIAVFKSGDGTRLMIYERPGMPAPATMKPMAPGTAMIMPTAEEVATARRIG